MTSGLGTALALAASILIAPNAAAWGSSAIEAIDPTLPGWVTDGGPILGVLGLLAWLMRALLPRAHSFFDRAHALLERVERKLDALDARDGDKEREELRREREALRAIAESIREKSERDGHGTGST
ncbi:MAG: hypothetical protein RIS45_787 [Planctomycetota bacterium]|jgi:integral membrane sensor domain MASE1